MDYEKAYNELVEKLKEYHNGIKDSQQVREFACYFPEVLEGIEKDDFIRDNLIDLVRNHEDSERYANMFSDWITRHDIHFEEKKTKKTSKKIPLELPIKHNFNEGDFIVCSDPGIILEILVVGKIGYAVMNCRNGASCNYSDLNYIDKNYHLWTINDAEPGDVLLSERDEMCCMFLKKLSDKLISVYCFKREYNNAFTIRETTLESSHFHPANFEKTDKFITELRQVGYSFNSSTKQLEQITQ